MTGDDPSKAEIIPSAFRRPDARLRDAKLDRVPCQGSPGLAMPLSLLTALSPLDGRYARTVEGLRPWFSELALIRHRVSVEIEWLVALGDEPGIPEVVPFAPDAAAKLRALASGFTDADGEHVKAIERETSHDVKAIEYWIRERVCRRPPAPAGRGIHPLRVHLGRTHSWRGNLLGYLEKVKADPTTTKLAHARMYDILMKPGVRDIHENHDPHVKRLYKDESLKLYDFFTDEFFGIEKTISQIVRYFHAASLKGEESRQVLYLMGPVGSGKSSLVEKLHRGLEETEPFYAIEGCPMFEEPLALDSAPSAQRV